MADSPAAFLLPVAPRSDTSEAYDEHQDVFSTLYLNGRQARELHEKLAELDREAQALEEVRRLRPPGLDPAFDLRWAAQALELLARLRHLNATRLWAQADNLEAAARLSEERGGESTPR